MELELSRLDLRYAPLRTSSTSKERRVLSSLDELGQQVPIVIVRDGERDVVVDGYKRVRALGRLGRDTVRATAWDLDELDALVLERIMRGGEHQSAIEEGWFLHELETRFGLSREELARRFDRTESWVSRRLALVKELPTSVQAHVRTGAIGAHAAMRYLVPLARANESDCEQMADAIAPNRPSSRELGVLYSTYTSGNTTTRELVVHAPALVLRAQKEAEREGDANKTPVEHLLEDLRVVSAVTRRARARIGRGAIDGAAPDEREHVKSSCAEARAEIELLAKRCEQESRHAG
jgi:ParB/RepB/Spo0J family partition protein